MSPCIAGLFELHLADAALVVVVLHGEMSVGDHLRVILRLLRHLALLLRLHLGLGPWPLALPGHLPGQLPLEEVVGGAGEELAPKVLRVRIEG